MKFFSITSLLLSARHVPILAQNADCPADNSGKIDKPFFGVTVNVLGRSFGSSYFMKKVAEWEELTGAIVNVPINAASGTELNELTEEDLASGADFYDGYIATNQNVPTLASQVDPVTKQSWILQLDDLVKNSQTLDWPGIDFIFREYLCLYDNNIYTLPFDGDQFLLFYRRDLQERDGWDIPKTWDELIALAEQYQGQDLDGDGIEDYAICQPNQGDMAFYSLYAPLLTLLQTHDEAHPDVKDNIFPKRHGVFMNLDIDGMTPVVDNVAMRKVMKLMKRIHELGQGEDLDLCCSTKDEGAEINSGHGLFKAGKCAFYYSFPSVGTNSIVQEQVNGTNETQFVYQHGRMGTAPLPGWTEYLNRETDTLQPCTVEDCPNSEKLEGGAMLNTASWFANGGMGAVINGRVSDLKQRAVFNLFAFFSKELTTTEAGMPYNPFRSPKHFQLDEYIDAGWNNVDAQLYLEAIQKSLKNPNAVMDLRVPYALQSSEDTRGFFRAYVHQFNELYRQMNEATDKESKNAVVESTITALHNEIQEWITRHDIRIESSDHYWTGEIENIYRRSMSLPLRAAPPKNRGVPSSIAYSILGVGAIVIMGSGFYVMKTQQSNIFSALSGIINPIAASCFEVTMIIFDVTGDCLSFLLVVRKDETVNYGFKLVYGVFVALSLGASLISIIVGLIRIRKELGWFKKSERAKREEEESKEEEEKKSTEELNQNSQKIVRSSSKRFQRQASQASSFSESIRNVISLKGDAKTQLEFAEAFMNLLLLFVEDLPMGIMNIVYIMAIRDGKVEFTVLYMLSFAGGLLLLGFKISKLREIDSFGDKIDLALSFMDASNR